MKKSVFILLLTFAMNVLTAQTSPTNTVIPKPVKTKFSTDYPNATPNWNLDGGNYSAEYYDQSNNLGRTVVYDKNGTIIRTDYELGAGSFPTSIGDYYTQNFPDESYRVWSSEDVNGSRVYYAKRKDQVSWFDKNGKYLPNGPVKAKKKSKRK